MPLSKITETRIKASVEAYRPHYVEDGEGARERFIDGLRKHVTRILRRLRE